MTDQSGRTRWRNGDHFDKLRCTSVFKEIDTVNELLQAASTETVYAESTIEDVESTLENYRVQISHLQSDIEKCKTDNQLVCW